MFLLLIKREWRTAWRAPQRFFQPLLFFILTLSLFPIALGTDETILRHSAPAALWIALLLAALLAGEQLFFEDYQDGTLSQDRIHCGEFWLLVLAKLLGAWLRFALPILLCLPCLLLLLHLPLTQFPELAAAMVLGSVTLLMIAMLGAALTISQQQGTFLLFLIVVPLYFPVLILGVGVTQSIILGLSFGAQMALLGALALFSALVMLPFATLALRAQTLP